jgi:hypothetical protein
MSRRKAQEPPRFEARLLIKPGRSFPTQRSSCAVWIPAPSETCLRIPGIYLAPLLQPGRYEVIVTKQGFAELKRENLALEVGQTLAVDLSLSVKAAQQSITVTTELGLVETEKYDVSQTITQTYVENLPMNGRR